MHLTETWREVFPPEVLNRYEFSETRSAAAIMQVTTPDAFDDLVTVLSEFQLTWEKLATPGGNRSVISAELDETFRIRGWREAKYDQDLTTRLTVYPWHGSFQGETVRVYESHNTYGGHKIDNVFGRAALDVEWNPKDGNLDRDIANYLSLHEAGIIDVGVMLVRSAKLRDLAVRVIEQVKDTPVSHPSQAWQTRMNKLPDNPFGTTTTANYEKLKPRLERGDGRGCPLLAIGITDASYVEPDGPLRVAVQEVAEQP